VASDDGGLTDELVVVLNPEPEPDDEPDTEE
jgi:hypothetical protein